MNTRGETLTETIIALTILAIGITIASAVTSVALRNMESARSRIVAINIAREGIEAVRSIRDTNWLRFSGNRRHCWYFMPQEAGSPSDQCNRSSSAEAMIQPGQYIIYKDQSGRWRLDSTTLASDGSSTTRLSYVDIDTGLDSDNDGTPDNDEDLFNHPMTNPDDQMGTGLTESVVDISPYERIITIEYLSDSGGTVDATAFTNSFSDNSTPNRMRVTSEVRWIRGNANLNVVLKTHLTDYLGRTNLDA